MNELRIFLTDLGVAFPENPHFLQAGIAAGIVILCWLIGWFAGRRLGPPLSGLWEKHLGARTEGIAYRMDNLLRNFVATLLLAVTLNVYGWYILPSFVVGLGLALAIGLLIVDILRGLQMPRWTAWTLAGLAAVAVLARSVGGLDRVTRVLDFVGVTIGTRRISLLTVLSILVIAVALFAAVRFANRLVTHSIKQSKGLDATQQLLVRKIASIVILVVAFFIGIDLIGIDLTALAVFSGAFGLAVGFGFQKTFGNLFAGIILLMDRSIKPGDVIAVGDSFGHVNKIGVRAVSIITRDGKEHLIPNENLMTEEVENWSYSSKNVRIHIPVGVSYGCDIQLAQKLMIEAALASKRVLKQPRPNVWLMGYGDSSVDHDILVWITDPEAGVGNVQSEILNRLWVLFRENDIEIPFPQRDVHVKSLPKTEQGRG